MRLQAEATVASCPGRLLTTAALLLLSLPAAAQTTSGVGGQVVESGTDAPVAGARVVATSDGLQGQQTALTDDAGQFELPLLPVGTYALRVTRDGFQTSTLSGLAVKVEQPLRVRVALLQGDTGEVLEIRGQRPLLPVTRAQSGGVITRQQLSLIPYGRDSRGFEEAALAIPGVHKDAYGLQVNGSGSPESQWLLDGVNVTNPAFGIQGTRLIQDFVEEVEVKTAGYGAEFGRSTGGVVNVVTKSGGNEFHGSVFAHWSPVELARRRVGNLGEAISTQLSQAYNLDGGAELGGPLVRDRLWFFVGFAPQVVARNWDRIISARLENGGSGAPSLDGAGNPLQVEVARKRYLERQVAYNATGKLTFLLNENHTFSLAAWSTPASGSGPNAFVLNGNPSAGALNGNEGFFLQDTTSGALDLSLRYAGKLLDSALLVEAAAGYHRERSHTNVIGLDGVPAAQLRDTPSVSFRQPHNLLDPYFLDDPAAPGYQRSAQVQAACAVRADGFDPCPVNNYFTGGANYLGDSTLQRFSSGLKVTGLFELFGHHQLKAGVDGSSDGYDQARTYSGGQVWYALASDGVRVDQFQAFRQFGLPDPANPGQPLYDPARPGHLLGDAPFSSTRNLSLATFVQDSWSIADLVVLNAGVRVERQKMYGDAAALDASGNRATLSLTNVMPRVGLSWDYTRRGLARAYASYGRFYEYVPLDVADRILTSEAQAVQTVDATSCRVRSDPRTCAVVPGSFQFFGGAGSTPVDPKLQGQYLDEFTTGVQQQVVRDVVLGLEYVHKRIGRVIEDMSLDDGNTFFLSNPGEPGKLGYQATTANGLVREPRPRRLYDGLTLSVNKPLSDGWLASASYTLSSLRGNYPGLFRAETGQLNPNTLSEYDLISLLGNRDGPLPGDIPNSFKLDAASVRELGPNLSVSIGGALRADQGAPTNYLGAHPTYGEGEAYILPRGSGPRLPWTWQLDVRLGVRYRFDRGYALDVTLDVFNLTNNRAVIAVDQNYTFDSVAPIEGGTPASLRGLQTVTGGPATPSTNYGNATAYQLPLSGKLGARLSF